MNTQPEQRPRKPGKGWFKKYVIGLGVGVACGLYGVVGLLMGKAFLPGSRVGGQFVAGWAGGALSAAYLAGGGFLALRFYLEDKVTSRHLKGGIYIVQNLLLLVFIVTVICVILYGGTAQ